MAGYIENCECVQCGSSAGAARYEDGGVYCHKGSHWITRPSQPNAHNLPKKPQRDYTQLLDEVSHLPITPLTHRGISQEAAEFYGIKCARSLINNQVEKVYFPWFNGTKVGYKAKFNNRDLPEGVSKKQRKSFYFGEPAKGFFGQHKYPQPSKMVIITEGEEDCPAAWDMIRKAHPQSRAYRVVSLRDGANCKKKDGTSPTVGKGFLENLDWLESHEKVILCFDQDEVGQDYAKVCAEVLTPGKAYIMAFSENDANAMLDNNKSKEFYQALTSAKRVVLDGIVEGGELSLKDLQTPILPGFNLPYPDLQSMTGGARTGELIILTGPSGMGKTTFCRELSSHLVKTTDTPVAHMFLEERLEKTQQGLLAINLNVPLPDYRVNPSIGGSQELQEKVYKEVIDNGRTYFYNHQAGISSDILLAKLRYFRLVFGCKIIFLDHLSLVISSSKSSREGERKDIDTLMTQLFQFVEQTDTLLFCISHLTQNKAKGSFNEGAPISLDDLRGSGSLGHLCHSAWALEGNQQSDEPNKRWLRVLKNREVGAVGRADDLNYVPNTGRLMPLIIEGKPNLPSSQLSELTHHEL